MSDEREPEVSLSESPGGVVQRSELLRLKSGRRYEWRLRVHVLGEAQIGITVSDVAALSVVRSEAWKRFDLSGSLFIDRDSPEDSFRLMATGRGAVRFECASLIPEGSVCGELRMDVLSELRALRPVSLRFPGGCYAEFYDWKQGLLPADDRPVITVKDMDFLLGPTFHQDPQDMNLDDFVQVCRFIGAKPQFTVKMTGTEPEDAAAVVEYANGGAETKWGAVRAASGRSAIAPTTC